MTGSNRRWQAIGLVLMTVLGIAGTASLAIAQWQNSPLMRSASNYWAPDSQNSTLGQLGNNEAVVVDLKSFNIAKAGAKGDTAQHIDKLKAREVGEGAVIFRNGNKLYIVDGKEMVGK